MTEFVHLHVHSEYSLRQGALRIDDCMRRCLETGMTAVAVTDTNALFGAVAFYRAARAAGIKPIIGVQLSVGRDEDVDTLAEGRPGGPPVDTAVFLAEDFHGYQNLVKLVTLANTRYHQPFITFSEASRHANQVFALIAGGESHVLKAFSSGQAQEAEGWLATWQSAWPATHLYVDVQDHGIADERQGLPSLVKWSRVSGVPLVATNDVHYLDAQGAQVQRVLAQLDGSHSPRLLQGDHYHLASPDEMVHRFAKLPEALANALALAERCNVEIPLGNPLQPKYPTKDGESSDVVLRRAAEAGVRQRYGKVDEVVQSRLEYELSIIERMGFADYFLVVADFIRFAHKNRISTGPGRGSAAGSLIAYALRITDVDPIHHNLLFERFLNPERVSWPDIDTDFEYERRGEVIQYVVERYGASHVAQIGTFGTLAARAAIRDGGRVLKIEPAIVDRLAKLIPSYPGVTLAKAYEEVPEIAKLVAEDHHAKQLWECAKGLEGFPRHTSIHAAGVVIAPIPLADLVPVQPGGDGTPVTQYAMEDIEHLGLIKMDFLGLRTLTLIDACTDSIARRTGQTLDWRTVSERDKSTYDMLSRGETNGCFQLESAGMRRVLRDLKPSSFEDIIAVISLYRPGPMENIPAFIAAKHGRTPVHYPHPDLATILQDTYGVVVYQEQIMQIASAMAGFSLGEADLLRRAVSKKKREVLDAERSRFVAGCVSKGYTEEVADGVYDLIVRFADYGFNRSHAAAYAVLAFRTAYLRANHLPDFMASLLSMVMSDAVKVKDYVKDAKQHGIEVLPPSVQHSMDVFTVASDKSIRTGLLCVKNVGKGSVEAVLLARADGPFKSLVDFLQRVSPRTCNRKVVESLLAAGALDEFLPTQCTPEAGLQILTEAYREAEEGRQSQGLGLRFHDTRTDAGMNTREVLYIRYDSRTAETGLLRRVKQTLEGYQGDVRVALYDLAKRKVRLLEARWCVTTTPDLISLLEELVGIGNAKIGHMPVSS